MWSSSLLKFLSSQVHSFFLGMYQIVDLTTPNVFALSFGLVFQRNDDLFTGSESSLHFILTVNNRFQMQQMKSELFYLLTVINEGITLDHGTAKQPSVLLSP